MHYTGIQNYDVVIASYDIMQREHFDDSEPQPLSRHWSRIILGIVAPSYLALSC